MPLLLRFSPRCLHARFCWCVLVCLRVVPLVPAALSAIFGAAPAAMVVVWLACLSVCFFVIIYDYYLLSLFCRLLYIPFHQREKERNIKERKREKFSPMARGAAWLWRGHKERARRRRWRASSGGLGVSGILVYGRRLLAYAGCVGAVGGASSARYPRAAVRYTGKI